MSIFSSIGHFLGSITGNDDDQKKKKQQAAAAAQAAKKNAAPTQSQTQQQLNNDPQQPSPYINQTQATKNPFGVNINPAALIKSNPTTTNTTTAAPAPKKPGLLTKIGHVAKDVGSVGAGASLGILRASEGLVEGATQIPKLSVDLGSYLGDKLSGTNYKPGFVKNVDQWTKDVDKPLDEAGKQADDASKNIGGPGRSTYKPVQVGANVATLIPAGAAVVTKAGELTKAPELVKAGEAVKSFISSQKAASPLYNAYNDAKNLVKAKAPFIAGPPVKAPDEVEVGIKSVNPNQADDAMKQISDATPPAPIPEETGPHIMNSTEQDTLDTLTKKGKTQVLAPEEQKTQQLLQAKQDLIKQANAPPDPNAPVVPSPETAQKSANITEGPPASGAPTDETIPQTVTDAPAPVNTPAPTVAPTTAPAPETAPNAPNIQAALEKFSDTPSKGGTHEVFNADDARTSATRTISAMSDDELVAAHQDSIHTPSNPQGVFNSVETIRRLEKLNKNPNAAQAISNLIDGVSEFESKAGQGLSVANAILEDMPVSMKVNVVLKKIDKLRIAADDDAKFPPIRENKKLEQEIMGNLKGFIEDSEDLKNQLAKTEAAVEKINADPAAALKKYGDRAGVTKQLDILDKKLTEQDLNVITKNGETIRYFDSLVPGKGNISRAADWARTTMLTAPTGRLNDAFTTGGNVLREAIASIPHAALGRVVNKIKGDGTVLDSTLFRKGAVRGTQAGTKAIKREFAGDLLAPDLNSAIKSTSMGGKGGLRRAPRNGVFNRVKNLTHAGTNATTNLTEGIKRAQLERLARQEGQKAGYSGDELKVYTHGRSLVPSRQMEAKAQELKDQVNNLNDNPWASKVAKFTSSEGGKQGKGYGALLQNMVVPFPKYMTTFAWNSITDKNVVAQTVKALRAAKAGDVDEVLKHIGGAVTDGAGVAMGYWLTQHGLITNNNAQGYNDDGAYLHIGNRYIPVGFLGFAGGSLVAGNAIHNAVNGGGNVLDKAAKIVGDTVANTVRMTGTQSLIGGDNPTVQALQSQFAGNKDTKTSDTAAVIAGQGAGQFIPGAFGDVNAALNNAPAIGPLKKINPTHEAADTKVISTGKTPTGKPSKAKDVPKSTVKSIENRIPGLSQTLPRKTGVAASDLLDRTTRGDRETSAELLVKSKAKTAADVDAADTKAGIPNPDGTYDKGDNFETAVENRIENQKYDQAIGGLQQKLASVQAGKDVTSKQTDPIEKQIKTVQVLKAGKYDPSIRDDYSGTGVDEWRAMGDPDSDTYNLAKYNELYAYDQALASAGAVDANKYTAKTSKSGSGSGKKSGTGNALGSTPEMKRLDLSALTPRKITDTSIPKIAPILSSDLIKARKISVSKA